MHIVAILRGHKRTFPPALRRGGNGISYKTQTREIPSSTGFVPVRKALFFAQPRHSTTGCSCRHFAPKWTQSKAATVISQADTATCQNRHLHCGRHEYVRRESTRGLCDCSRGISLSLQAGIRETAAFVAVQESVDDCRSRDVRVDYHANFARGDHLLQRSSVSSCRSEWTSFTTRRLCGIGDWPIRTRSLIRLSLTKRTGL